MNFDISRLRRSDQIIGVSAILLFIFLFFFKWLGFSSSTPLGGLSASSDGWNSFHNSRWLWIITIIVALGAVAVSAGMFEFKSPVQLDAVVAALGALSTVFIVYRIIHHPSGGASGTFGAVHVSYSYGIKIGIWLGLIAAVGITYGGYLGMRESGTSLSDVRAQASGAVSGLSSAVGSGSTGSTGSAGGSSEPAAPPIPPPAAPPIPPPAPPAGPEPPGSTPA